MKEIFNRENNQPSLSSQRAAEVKQLTSNRSKFIKPTGQGTTAGTADNLMYKRINPKDEIQKLKKKENKNEDIDHEKKESPLMAQKTTEVNKPSFNRSKFTESTEPDTSKPTESSRETRKREMEELKKQSKVSKLAIQEESESKNFLSKKKDLISEDKSKPSESRSSYKQTFLSSVKTSDEPKTTKRELDVEIPSISSKKSMISKLFQTNSDYQNVIPVRSSPSSPVKIQNEPKVDSCIEINQTIADSFEVVEALYDYEAQDKNELSFKEGEILNIHEKMAEDWIPASNNKGDMGFIPANYVKVVEKNLPEQTQTSKVEKSVPTYSSSSVIEPPISNSYTHEAVYDYTADEDNELSFEEGEKFTIIEKTDKDWWTVTNSTGITGLVPSNYVKLIPESGQNTIMEMQKSEPLSFKECYKVIHDYDKDDEGELSLKKDEIVTIVATDASGWWLANNSSYEQGYVPSNYLEKC
ncbi:hypothetical protein HZS_3230 [Henneguya salminicola]|nr:hypothetical protein HZS_3230 [Henneguya salminicola]